MGVRELKGLGLSGEGLKAFEGCLALDLRVFGVSVEAHALELRCRVALLLQGWKVLSYRAENAAAREGEYSTKCILSSFFLFRAS